ncbi:T9SS type A sorting domain-containing protein [Gilvibacter sediminis]|uniref:T9SS type A sorting domain-containing protein n=1 Tax=Gilvibacter sediminis TaxID=379071 RepID=UPI0023504579|nr:T9SS type A sorting domain-containing protein [Gilvibacter sediminis]MDC7996477.1 T9SS type A sorting domain-containing protein [Gilvibacter sediminis]
MKTLFVLFGLALSCFPLMGQEYELYWQNSFGGSAGDAAMSIIETPDGHFIAAGHSSSGISGLKTVPNYGNSDYWVIKFASDGTILWQRGFGGDTSDSVRTVLNAPDGGYLVAGTSLSGVSGNKTVPNYYSLYDFWFVKVDADGNEQWQKVIGANNSDHLRDIVVSSDGGYIMGGTSDSSGSFDKNEPNIGGWDYWVLKLNADLEIQWQNTIGGTSNDWLESLYELADGGVILGGTSISNSSADKSEESIGGVGSRDYWIVRLDDTGAVVWDRTLGGLDWDGRARVLELPDGRIVVAGTSRSNSYGHKSEDSLGSMDVWALLLDTDGTILWENTIGGDQAEEVKDIKLTPEGDIMVATTSSSAASADKSEPSVGGSDFWLFLIDTDGNVLWDDTIGGYFNDGATEIKIDGYGNLLVSGASSSAAGGDHEGPNYGEADFWILKMDNVLNTFEADGTLLEVYPNPSSGLLNIQTNQMILEVKLYDQLGRTVNQLSDLQASKSLDLSNLASGVYHLKIVTESGTVVKRVIMQTR